MFLRNRNQNFNTSKTYRPTVSVGEISVNDKKHKILKDLRNHIILILSTFLQFTILTNKGLVLAR